MSVNPSFKSPDLKEPLLTEVVEDVPPPAYDAPDVKAAIAQPTTSPESQQVSRVKMFFLTILYTIAFTIATLFFCLYGSLTNDEASTAIAVFGSILGSVILGPIYFTNQRFMACVKARNEVISIYIANGRLVEAFRHSLLHCAIVTGVVASAATIGCGLIFWPFAHVGDLSTEKMLVGTVLVPVACLHSGLRWTYEAVSMAMWILVKIPRISTGLEGEKYDNLLKTACVFVLIRFLGSFLMLVGF